MNRKYIALFVVETLYAFTPHISNSATWVIFWYEAINVFICCVRYEKESYTSNICDFFFGTYESYMSINIYAKFDKNQLLPLEKYIVLSYIFSIGIIIFVG